MDGAARRSWILLALWACGCDAAGRDLDVEALDARDLLGVESSIAAGWDAADRAVARARLMEAWAESLVDGRGALAEDVAVAAPDPGRPDDGPVQRAVAALSAADQRRDGAGSEPVIGGVGEVAGRRLRLRIAEPLELDRGPASAAGAGATGGTGDEADAVESIGWRPDEASLVARGAGWALDLAAAAGHPRGAPLRVRPARQAPFGAVYLGEELGLVVNPVLLASLEPIASAGLAAPAAIHPERDRTAAREGGDRGPGSAPVASGGNPYSFYGSVAECAAAERRRCEACLPSASCEQTSRDAEDGEAECQALGGGEGRGYYLYCVNLSLAIATVAGCVREEGPSCPQDDEASNRIERLEVNQVFLDDAACAGELDGCLASIYGEPDDDFPPPAPDAGPGPDGGAPPEPPAPPPPREIDVSCGEADCDFSPQCDSSCSGSCDDALSCDADCNGSGGDSGGGGGCDGCGGGDGGDGGGSGDGCGGGGDGGGGDGGGGDGCGGCGSDPGGSDSGGGDCGGGDCGGSDCGGSDCGGDCNSSGGGGSSCAVARDRRCAPRAAGARACRRRPDGASGLLALAWAVLPLPYLERSRRRGRRHRAAGSSADVRR